LNNIGQMKNAYWVSVIGVALMAITTAYGAVRAVMIREMLQTAGGFGGRRPFGSMNPFGLTNGLAVLALIIAIVGLAWLGLAIRKSHEGTAK
jgi:hypothetical protein